MTETTQTGIPFIDCEECGKRHPAGRSHCAICGTFSLFSHEIHSVHDHWDWDDVFREMDL